MSWNSSSEVVVVEGVVSVYWLSALYRRDRLIPAYCTHRNYIYLCMYVYILRIYELSPNEILYVCMYVCITLGHMEQMSQGAGFYVWTDIQ